MKKWSLVLTLILCLSLTACQASASGLFGQLEQMFQARPTATPLPAGDTVTISRQEYEELIRFKKVSDMMAIVDTMYYQEVDEEKLLDGVAQGMMLALEDPYSFYYNAEDFAEMWEDDEGNYAGIGIQISGNYVTQLCTVSRVFADTPAREAGILKGDILYKVEDITVTANTLQDAVDIMRGEVGTTVNVTVLRGEDEISFEIPRAQVHVNRVEYTLLEDGLGYICLYEFAGDCRVKFAEAVHSLVQQGAQRLILDLRDNPGGWVEDAVAIADMFLDEGVCYYLQYRQEDDREYVYTQNGKVDVKMVVLLNEFSASSSEILSGALQDHGAAKIVGVQSYGKGVVQYVLPVGEDGSGMQFTAAQYFTPNGNAVHKVGITPDVEVPLPEGSNGMFEFADIVNDVQLQKAIEVVKGM
ncbi:MAG: S41 family peptidase [Clostridia bacterium]|nr:S41 family peptidase [Clostridia bacterium]